MKLYNISGRCNDEFKDDIGFAGLFYIDENDEVEEVYYIDDKDNQDKYLFRDLAFMKNLGKVMFDVMKKHDVEDVIIIEDVKIDAEYYDVEFVEGIAEIIKGEEK